MTHDELRKFEFNGSYVTLENKGRFRILRCQYPKEPEPAFNIYREGAGPWRYFNSGNIVPRFVLEEIDNLLKNLLDKKIMYHLTSDGEYLH